MKVKVIYNIIHSLLSTDDSPLFYRSNFGKLGFGLLKVEYPEIHLNNEKKTLDTFCSYIHSIFNQ